MTPTTIALIALTLAVLVLGALVYRAMGDLRDCHRGREAQLGAALSAALSINAEWRDARRSELEFLQRSSDGRHEPKPSPYPSHPSHNTSGVPDDEAVDYAMG